MLVIINIRFSGAFVAPAVPSGGGSSNGSSSNLDPVGGSNGGGVKRLHSEVDGNSPPLIVTGGEADTTVAEEGKKARTEVENCK